MKKYFASELKYNYNHLYYFWQVALVSSFTAASIKLGVAQPSLSTTIDSLEKYLGVELFKPQGKGITLTNSGCALFSIVSRMFSEIDLIDEIKELK